MSDFRHRAEPVVKRSRSIHKGQEATPTDRSTAQPRLALCGLAERPLSGNLIYETMLRPKLAHSCRAGRPLSGILTAQAINRDTLTHLILATSIQRCAEYFH